MFSGWIWTGLVFRQGLRALLEASSRRQRAALFYYWEPDMLLPPRNDYLRLNFEDPIACRSSGATSLYPPNRACDFEAGGVHPNDHVNMGQSSNDTFPTAMSVATT